MKALRLAVAFLALTSSAGFTFASAALVLNCAGSPVPEAQAAVAKAAEGAYTLELVQCEQEAGTRAAGATCRCGVDVKFGVDGGNCK